MNFYDSAFLLLISICGVLTWRQYRGKESPEKKSLTRDAVTPRARAEARHFTRNFVLVFAIVQASDWLQGMIPMGSSLTHF
jgi:hypothetical protein